MIDLTNKKFAKLKVLKYVKSNKYGQAVWLCLCKCGNKKEVLSMCLVHKRTKSCGCYRRFWLKKKIRKPGSAFRGLYQVYKSGAKRRNIQFDLTLAQFKDLTSGNCYYCNSLPKNVYRIRKSSLYKYNGIDRKNNKKGYVLKNSLTCCHTCNRGKSDLTYFQWIKYLENLIDFRSKL